MSQPAPPPGDPPPQSPHAGVDPDIVAAFAHAQARTLGLAAACVGRAEVGARPRALLAALDDDLRAAGFVGWFSPPQLRVNGRLDADADAPLRAGALVELRLAPLDPDAFGAFATTARVGGGAPPAALTEARELCRSTCGFASRWKSTGELFVYATSWANNRRRSLGDAVDVGHLCFPRRGRAGWAWPYAARAAVALRRHRIQWLNPRRMRGHYFVYPRLQVDGLSAGFGELVLIDGDRKELVGRQPGVGAGSPPA